MDLRQIRRKPLRLAADKVVRVEQLRPEQTLPLVVRPRVAGVDALAWADKNHEFIEQSLSRSSAILFRDFRIKSPAEFRQFIETISGPLLSYEYRSTPRSQVEGGVYTSTEYPAEQSIPLHNENSYAHTWPMRIWFFCAQPAYQGGETPIADSRRIFELLDPRIRERFIQKQVMYVRNYGQGIDLSWSESFQTHDKTDVENYCRQSGIDFEWRSDDRLSTRQVCPAVMPHPRTGEMVWFNQAHLFHVSSLLPEVRESLLKTFPEEELPRNAYYGDGSAIENSVLDEIRRLYKCEMVVFPWQNDDILMLDNMLVAHGRNAFTGPREVLVGMTEAYQP